MSGSVHPIADPTDSLLGWASQYDLGLQQKLEPLTIVAQLDISTDEMEKVEKFYGIFLARQIKAGSTLAALLSISPAMALVTLVHRAKKLVEAHNFAAEYIGGLGLDSNSELVEELEEILDDELLTMLGNQGLLTFDTDPVHALCWHAGVINNEVPALLEALDSAEDPTQAVLPTYFAGLSAAAPERAGEIFDAVLALRTFALSHPNSWSDRSRKQVLPALSPHIDESFVAELRERPVGTPDREAAVGVAHREMRPRIVIDPRRRKVCLRLPEQRVPARGEITWRVSVEGSTTVYRTGRAFGDVTGFSEPLDITLAHPVREVTVEDLANGITWDVPVVNAEDPLLLFNKRGGSVTTKRSLHHQRLRALMPSENKLIDVVSGADIHPSSSFAIDGWAGWICHNVELAGVDSVDAVAPGEHPDIQRARSVDPRQRVMFCTPGAPIADVTTMTGLAVHAESLQAEFPPTASGRTEMWHLSISSFGGAGTAGEEITQPEPLEVPAEGGVFEVFDPELYDAPWVGEYLVRLRGPRNESFRHEFAIVEGMRAVTTFAGMCGSFRIPAGGGLSESTLIVKPSAKPFDVEPKNPQVFALDAGADFVVSTEEGDALPLRFTPKRLNFELPLNTEPAMWRASRMTIHPRHVDMDGQIRVRGAGVMGDPKISVINHHGQPVKTTTLVSPDQGLTYVAPMSKIVSTTNTLPKGRVNLEWTDPATDKRISVVLADVETTEPATVELVDYNIVVGSDDPHLGVWIWPATAPWEPADTFVVVPDSEGAGIGRVTLPEEFRDAGNLIVQVHTRDRFTALHTPVAPGPEATVVQQPGFFGEADGALGTLSAFMSGISDEVPTDASVMPVLWDMLAAGGRREEARAAVRAVFNANPNQALRGLSNSLVKAEQQPGRFIETGLVRCLFDAAVDEDESYHRAAWIGTLELMGALNLLYGQEGISAADRPAAKEIYQALKNLAGENVLASLKSARDHTLDSACIDRSTVMIAGLDPAQQKAILNTLFAEAQIVPGAVMDDGSRLLAVFETFKKRKKLNEMLAKEQLIASAVTLLRTLRSTNKALYALARIRFDKLDGVDTNAKDNMWALAPVVSLVLALAARMSAHGLISSNKTLDQATTGWAKLADIVPDLVTSDLVAAEAIVLAIAKPGIA
ncbi:MAG: hypothetical protein Q4A31_09230 [Corynebacterium sp.]|uniref:hypothetical protein n=1 Tax=Corynebacterium sp. TaxID=1720 RepID=UPI0026DD1CF9|nr:hypothetical protein [Corynebacterium sp.]MDO4762086.1 hypothetical protein [Corynebacterium sp.]